MARPERRFINYPTNQLLGVLDSPEESDGAMAELVARGVPAADVLQLSGPEGAARLDGIGTSSGILPRFLRAVQFMTMDQMPDFLVYETATRAGRTVLAVRVKGAERRALVIDVLTRHDAHFLNLYARFATEEISRWRGPEPQLPGVLRR